MESHRDNKKWKQWSLESTAKILERRFPNSFVWVIRPSRYHQSTFACYHNFVEANLLGVPDHTNHDYGALFHLRALLESAVKKRKYSESFCLDKFPPNEQAQICVCFACCPVAISLENLRHI